MATQAPVRLLEKKCQPCEGGVQPLSATQANTLLPQVTGWSLTVDGKGLTRSWRVQDYSTSLDFFRRIGDLAEAEDHHPDLHLTGYRNVRVELSTHAINGLSENDFIMAAKINQLPVALKTG